MANRIDQIFVNLKKRKAKALIGYLTAGFPTKSSFRRLVPLLEQNGVDVLELGVPFSDPIADGPTIQFASQVALKNGVTLDWILNSVKALRGEGVRFPIIFMSYCNPIHAMGIDRFFQRAQSAGVDGVIIPDLVPEEGGPYGRAAKRYGLDLIYLVAPTTPKARIRAIAKQTHGFLYAVSLMGVTGVQKVLPKEVSLFLKSIKTVCKKPIAVGFGLSTPRQVRNLSHHADGVIVGSALIRAVEKSKGPRYEGVARFVRSLKGALHAY
jgi:tryptophan synthase alpha chain